MSDNNYLKDLLGNRSQVSVTDQLYQQISDLILTNKLPEGYVFPNETVLCEQLSVGRTSLREAYKALELTGYVTRSKRGTFVNSRDIILGATPLRTVFNSASSRDFIEFRLMIERECAYQAALKASFDDIQKLEKLVEVSQAAKEKKEYQTLIETDLQFHRQIAIIANNELLSATVNIMYDSWKTHVEKNFLDIQNQDSPIFVSMLTQHREIVDAINKRDPKLAKLAMHNHVSSVSSSIISE